MAAAQMDIEVRLAQLLDSDASIRTDAAKALGRFGAAAALPAAGPLARALEDGEAGVRIQAARALGKMGDAVGIQAVRPLTVCLADVEADVRAAAAAALGWMAASAGGSGEAVEAMAQCLKDADARVRAAAAGAFGRMGAPQACAAAEALAQCLQDDDTSVQVTAAGALARHREPAMLALMERLEDRDAAVRRRAARALGRFGGLAAPSAAEALVRHLRDDSRGVRVEAVNSLCLMGRNSMAGGSAPPKVPIRAIARRPEDSKAAETRVKKPGEGHERADAAKGMTLAYAGGHGQPETEVPAVTGLPRLLGTPTPTPQAADKPDFGLFGCSTPHKESFAAVAVPTWRRRPASPIGPIPDISFTV